VRFASRFLSVVMLCAMVSFAFISCKPAEIAKETTVETATTEATSTETAAPTEEAEELDFVIMAKGVHPWFEPGGEGFAAAAEKIGGIKTRYVAPAEWSGEAQAKMMEDLISEGVDGIAVAVFDVDALVPVINEAISIGIPVVTWDADADGSDRVFFSGTDNLSAGKLTGEEFVKFTGGKANFVIFCQELTGKNIKQRIEGIRSVTKNSPDMVEVTDEQPYNNDMGKALELSENIIDAYPYPKLNAALDVGVEGVVAMGKTLKERGIEPGKYVLIDWAALPDVIAGINDGYITATLEQNAYAMGYFSAYALKYYSDGKKPNKTFFNTGIATFTKENIGNFGEINRKNAVDMQKEFEKLWE